MRTFEILHIRGSRVVDSFTVKSDSHGGADKASEAERKKRGIRRYRIIEPKPNGLRHGGAHARFTGPMKHY